MTLKDCIERVVMFNDIACNLDNVTGESILAQAKCVKEEGDELYEAVRSGDVNEILKECADCLVVITGFYKMLEQQGYDVLSAWNEVNNNNLSKFTSSLIDAEESVDYYRGIGVATEVAYNEFYGVYILKDENGKVRKPISYKKASVTKYTPKGIAPVVQGGA